MADPFYHTLEHRIETNAQGQIITSPPPSFNHSKEQFEIGYLLRQHLKNGAVLTECPVSTSKGVRAIDTAWISKSRERVSLKGILCTIAPEICVEVISLSNTHREMAEKKALHFDAGAAEVWFCSDDGQLSFFLADSPDTPATSKLCPDFPQQIETD